MEGALRYKTPSSILIVGPSSCGKTCFTKSLLLDHFEELFVNPSPTFHYCNGAGQDGLLDILPPSICNTWFPKGGLLLLDDLMVERGEEKALLGLIIHQTFT